MKRADILKRVDLNVRYSLSGSPSDSEYIFAVLIFLCLANMIVEMEVTLKDAVAKLAKGDTP